jgi:hypothetical protein
VTLGVRVGRRWEAEEYSVSAVLASWGLFVAGILLGLVPDEGRGQLGTLWLYVVALAAGLGAAWFVRRNGAAPELPAPAEPEVFDPGVVAVPSGAARISARAGIALGVGAAVAVVVALFQGLRVGFL